MAEKLLSELVEQGKQGTVEPGELLRVLHSYIRDGLYVRKDHIEKITNRPGFLPGHLKLIQDCLSRGAIDFAARENVRKCYESVVEYLEMKIKMG